MGITMDLRDIEGGSPFPSMVVNLKLSEHILVSAISIVSVLPTAPREEAERYCVIAKIGRVFSRC